MINATSRLWRSPRHTIGWAYCVFFKELELREEESEAPVQAAQVCDWSMRALLFFFAPMKVGVFTPLFTSSRYRLLIRYSLIFDRCINVGF